MRSQRSRSTVDLGYKINRIILLSILLLEVIKFLFIIIEQNRYRSITKEIALKFLTCHQQIIQLNADMLSLHRRPQLETPFSFASSLPKLHKVPNSNYVALQTANIWIFEN